MGRLFKSTLPTLLLVSATVATADNGTYIKLGSELSRKEEPARYVSFGYQGRTDFFLDYQLEGGIISNSDLTGRIRSSYLSGALGVSTAHRGLYAKVFFGASLALDNLGATQDFELGICGDDSIAIGLFIKRMSDFKLLDLPFSNDFVGAKIQIPL